MIENSGTDLQFVDLAVEVARHHTFTKQLEALHLGFDQAAPVITALFFPDFPTKPPCGHQDGIAGFVTKTMLVLPRFGVFASGDDRLCPTLHNRFAAAFGVVCIVATDARDRLFNRNLAEHVRQYWRIAGGIVCHR